MDDYFRCLEIFPKSSNSRKVSLMKIKRSSGLGWQFWSSNTMFGMHCTLSRRSSVWTQIKPLLHSPNSFQPHGWKCFEIDKTSDLLRTMFWQICLPCKLGFEHNKTWTNKMLCLNRFISEKLANFFAMCLGFNWRQS